MADHNNSGKDPLFLNKVAGGILASVLFIMVISEVGGVIYDPQGISEPAYVIDIPEAGASAEDEAPIDIFALVAAGDVDKGKRLSKKCLSCHTFEKGKGGTQTGPELYNVLGRAMGSQPGFGSYSNAMKSAGGTWDIESLFGFIQAPKKFMKGTGMSFAGFKKGKEQDVADLIAYMNAMSDAPQDLAAASE